MRNQLQQGKDFWSQNFCPTAADRIFILWARPVAACHFQHSLYKVQWPSVGHCSTLAFNSMIWFTAASSTVYEPLWMSWYTRCVMQWWVELASIVCSAWRSTSHELQVQSKQPASLPTLWLYLTLSLYIHTYIHNMYNMEVSHEGVKMSVLKLLGSCGLLHFCWRVWGNFVFGPVPVVVASRGASSSLHYLVALCVVAAVVLGLQF